MSIQKEIKEKIEKIGEVADYFVEDFDASEYEPIRLEEITESDIGRKITTDGWVYVSRTLAKGTFFNLRSAQQEIKCITHSVVHLNHHLSMKIYGKVTENRGRDEFPFEVHVYGYEIKGKQQDLSFPVKEDSDKDTLLKFGHLALRLPQRAFFLEARSYMLRLCREFYWKKKYCEITPPTIVQTQVEGGSTLFKMDYYGEEAYLTQSSQLYLETVVPVAGKAFCIMPSYRAEKSRTSRHLSEFTHVEAELAHVDFEQLMDEIEALIRYVTEGFYKEFGDKLKKLDPEFTPVTLKGKKFLKITHSEAIDFFVKEGHKKTDGTPYKQGDDISDASEKFLIEKYAGSQPVFLIRFPQDHKPFYVKKDEKGTQTCDLLFPGLGEIVGGSMRADVYKDLVDGFVREGIDPKNYYWYLDMSKYGPCSHGGYGLGFERLMQCLCKYKSVDQATLYPRKPNRCTP